MQLAKSRQFSLLYQFAAEKTMSFGSGNGNRAACLLVSNGKCSSDFFFILAQVKKRKGWRWSGEAQENALEEVRAQTNVQKRKYKRSPGPYGLAVKKYPWSAVAVASAKDTGRRQLL